MGGLPSDSQLETWVEQRKRRIWKMLRLLCLATLATCNPTSYFNGSPQKFGSFDFSQFMQRQNNPYKYMKDHMANVAILQPKATTYSHHNQYMDNGHSDWEKYMLGEVFFKGNDQNQHIENDHDHYDENEEELPYRVVQKFQNYEKRYYPSAKYVCNTTSVDTAADPLAGLERMNPFEVMMSRRFSKTPKSQQFMELFRYIQGVNQKQEEIEMTRPVVMFHNITRETTLGNYEDQTMCFYLPQKYQEHQHDEEHDHQETKPNPRHAPQPAPEPLNNKVFLYTRPPMEVFVRRFGGFALTHDTWETHRNTLEEDILGQKYNPREYFTVQYDNPWKLTKKTNEVWIQSLQQFQTLPAPVDGAQPRKSLVAKNGKFRPKPKTKGPKKN